MYDLNLQVSSTTHSPIYYITRQLFLILVVTNMVLSSSTDK